MRYRSLTNRYLASDGVYHLIKIFFKLHSQATWLVHKETRFDPCFDHDASLYQVLFASRTGVSPYILHFSKQNGASRVEFRKVINWVLRTWPFVYTTSLRSIPARRKFSAWARSFLFIRHYSGNHRYFLFPPLIKMLQFSGLLLFKLKYKKDTRLFAFLLIF